MKKINKLLSMVLISGMLLEPMSAKALTKKESVYTNLEVDGKISKTTVTNHLLVKGKQEIEDETELKEILNINGIEKYENKDNKLIWENKGNDIFYQGVTEKENPIGVTIDYFLDGKKMDAKDMIGEKGNVKIVLSFANHSKNTVIVNGLNETIYTPFLVTAGTILDNKTNSNISISNGKVVDSGTRSILLALATPGLYESIGLEDLKQFNTITIEYQTTKFSLGNIYIVATPKLIEETDLNVFDKLNHLSSSVNLLQQNMNTIEKGAKDLLEGSKKVNGGAELISSNLNTAVNAVEQLKNGSLELKQGITLMKNQILSQLGVNTNNDSVSELKQLQAQNNNTASTLLASVGMDYATLEATVNAGGSGALYESQKSTYGLVTLLYGNNKAIAEVLSQLENPGGNVNALLLGFQKLEAGSDRLVTSLGQLQSGVTELSNGANTLVSGTKQLQSGATTLSTGITKFNHEGIHVLSGAMDKVGNYTSKAEALVNLSKNYNGFTSNNAQTTTFIYQVKSLKSK